MEYQNNIIFLKFIYFVICFVLFSYTDNSHFQNDYVQLQKCTRLPALQCLYMDMKYYCGQQNSTI